MGTLNLDDPLGFFRELVDPNFSDFYWDFQSEEDCDQVKLIRVFRKMVNLCLTLNHLADKNAIELGYGEAKWLIPVIRKHYPAEGAAIDAVRQFSNNVKHKSKLDHNFATRKRTPSDSFLEGQDLPEWSFTTKSGEKVAICSNVIDAYLFWGKWFAGERVLPSKNT
ncbi:hypothetical protein DET50_1075 [Marinobacter pelagius]|uniref:Uncharacterized protein n=1 Tax=Marinobacter pelagius TaxID=379482 RepID=A0A366GV89_9GAMM|nr:hypothetical protein [Marinobacter pelagius]RBP30591.1 hypothetical protein DET50_1075 [Marinobacter pelagius]